MAPDLRTAVACELDGDPDRALRAAAAAVARSDHVARRHHVASRVDTEASGEASLDGLVAPPLLPGRAVELHDHEASKGILVLAADCSGDEHIVRGVDGESAQARGLR